MDIQHTEQTKRIEEDIRTVTTRLDRHLEIYAQNGKELAALKTEVANLVNGVADLKKVVQDASKSHVTRREFNTVRTIVYGAAGLILTGVFAAVINLVIV